MVVIIARLPGDHGVTIVCPHVNPCPDDVTSLEDI